MLKTLGLLKTLIIADDLTGAADCAAACGPGTRVVLRDAGEIYDAEAVAFDADTRRMDAEHASAETARIVRAHPAGLVYKKIDSTLRGHVRAEIEAALTAYREIGHPEAEAVVAPAFPAMDRITRGGRHYVRGVALDTGNVPDLCDAETDGDLRALVAKWTGCDVLWAGSAGLMQALMSSMAKPEPLPLPKIDGPIVFAAGSNTACSRGQIEALRDTADAVILTGEAKILAEQVSRRERIGALVLTGGDTARAVLLALGITALRIASEVEAGVPILITEGPRPIPVVTKAGDFGDRDTLMRCLHRLR